MIAEESRVDAGAFLTRLLRLDANAVVRLRPVGGGVVSMWAQLPFGVLVTRGLRATIPGDTTVRARQLLSVVGSARDGPLAAVDSAWRWPLPSAPGTAVETLPAREILGLAEAAAATVREVLASGTAGRAVGTRRVRDAMLDHVPIVVQSGPDRIAVSQRLVQGLVRMGFVGDEPVTVRSAGRWTGLDGEYGSAWQATLGETLGLQITPYRPKG